MKTLSLIISLFLVQQCDAQKQKNFEKQINTKVNSKMKRPSINNRFETLNLENYKDQMRTEKIWSVGDRSYYNLYKYKAENENEIIEIEGTKEYNTLRYRKTYKEEPYIIFKNYYGESGYIKSKGMLSKNTQIVLGEEYQFDESGKLIQTIDHDKGWDFSYEDVMSFVKEKYKDKVLQYDLQYAFNIQKKKTFNNKNYWEILVKPDFATEPHKFDLLKLDGMNGKILCYQQWTDDYGEPETLRKTIIPDATILPKEKNTAIYKTHNGLSYTQAEWEAYEEKEYEEYCKRTGKTYTPKDQRATLENSNKSKFEADDTDLGTPKPKKGFWDNLLG